VPEEPSLYKIINRKKLYATMVADVVGNLVYLPSSLLKRREEIRPGSVKEILLIRTAYIGDVVMTLPVLKPLSERFPGARITFLTSRGAEGVLTNNPYVDEILTHDPFWFYPGGKSGYREFMRSLKERAFDLVIEARGDIRELLFLVRPIKARYKVSYDVGGGGYLLTHVVPYGGLKHKVEYHLDIARFLGCEVKEPPEAEIYLTDSEKKRAASILEDAGIRGEEFVALHPGGRKPLKCWPHERYAEVADRVAEEFGMPVVLTGTPAELGLAERVRGAMRNKPVVLAGKTDLRGLAGVLSRASLLVANDSSPMHIAAAVKTAVVALFGPSKSVETAPWGEGHVVVEKDFPCRARCDEDVCKFVHHNQCMKDIKVEDVFSALRAVLKAKRDDGKKRQKTLH